MSVDPRTHYQYCPLCGESLLVKNRSDQDPIYCQNAGCDFVEYKNPYPVVAAIIEYERGVLLAHNKQWPPKILAPISGFVDCQESPIDAVRREVLEETGLNYEHVQLIGVYPHTGQNQIIIAYSGIGVGHIQLGDELDSYKIISKEKLQPWPFGTGLAIKDWLAN